MNRLFEWVVKAVLILIFAPLLLCLAFQWMTAVLAAILPWLIALSVIAGLTAGLSAGLMIRRRLPPPQPPGGPLGAYRVRRMRGIRR
jgi:hypothetical protein